MARIDRYSARFKPSELELPYHSRLYFAEAEGLADARQIFNADETLVYTAVHGAMGLAQTACQMALEQPDTHVLLSWLTTDAPQSDANTAPLEEQGRLHTALVEHAEVGARIYKEDLQRSTLAADYGEALAYEDFPAPADFLAEVGVEKFARSHQAKNLGRVCYIAIRSEIDDDTAVERRFVDAHRASGTRRRGKVRGWNGAHTNF